MTPAVEPLKWNICPLFLAAPETELKDIIEEGLELLRRNPEILSMIHADQDDIAKEKKKLRLQDKRYIQEQTETLPGIELKKEKIKKSELVLEYGRSRMEPEAVFIFLQLRGYWGSISTTEAINHMKDSLTLFLYVQERGIKMPATTTILENINSVSNSTRDYILTAQMRMIIDEGLDDFTKVLLDSTSVESNSSWPTDAGILLGLLRRVFHYGQKLEKFDVPPLPQGWMVQWLKKLKKLHFRINQMAGKPKSQGKLKNAYRQFLKTSQKAHDYLIKEYTKVKDSAVELVPSRRHMLEELLKGIENDLSSVSRVLYYTDKRVIGGIVLPSSEKILSISDETAAFIKKGQRESVIGYKPQLARSGNGFVASLQIDEGNGADSKYLVPLVKDVKNRTGVTPSLVSADDGYCSKDGREALLELGVKDVSISGSKGKKITPQEKWDSDFYQQARRDRSAVESLIFMLKHSYEFGRLKRRGLEAVRAELLEKVIAYNFCRMVLIKKARTRPPVSLKKVA